MSEPSIWELTPTIVHFVYSPRRVAFSYEVETYEQWALLAPGEGSFTFALGADREESGTCEFGDLVLCPAGVPLWRWVRNLLSFHFLRFIWKDAEGRICQPVGTVPTGKFTLQDRARLASDFAYLRHLAARRGEPEARRRADHLLRDLLLLPSLEALRDAPPVVVQRADPLMGEIEQRLIRNACGEVSLQAIAAEAGLRPVQLTRRFTAATGTPPLAYLTELRLQKARSLLLETEDTLDEIAEQVGYCSGFYLSRLFTRKVGMNPSRFRRLHRV